ncbi:MAG TPA: hypothetical protein VMS56_05795 [Thermoanaerobaculia bacterium]|nr:hypothetical protein [Thermoanaerobaculia bacterium]
MKERRAGLGEAVRIFLLLALLLFGGMALGQWLAGRAAPGSILADLIGFLTFPLCLGIGMTLWYQIAFAVVWTRLLRALVRAARGTGDRERAFREAVVAELRDLPREAPPGTWVFVPVSLGISLVAGALVGLAPAAESFIMPVILFGTYGLAYGVLLRWLAVTGRLPIPEDA